MLRFKAILFLFVFTLSSFGKSVQVHYCHGELTDMAFFGSVKCVCPNEFETEPIMACHQEEKSHCDHDEGNKDENHTKMVSECCKTAVIQLAQAVDFQTRNVEIFPLIFFVSHYNPGLFLAEPLVNNVYSNYTSPLITTDLSIRLQTFLI